MNLDPKEQIGELVGETINAAPSKLLVRYTTVVTCFVLVLSYAYGRSFLSDFADFKHQSREYDLCNELRFITGSKERCRIEGIKD